MKLNIQSVIFAILILIVAGLFLWKNPALFSNKKNNTSQNTANIPSKEIREISVVSEQYSFTPNVIKLKLNESVRLRLTTEDVPHSFFSSELGINETINPGKESIIEITPDKKGAFTFLCSIPCGEGHSEMRGTIVVE